MLQPFQNGNGFVYVATGKKYRLEAAEAAASLRATNPNARICLVTDCAEGPTFWDDVVLLETPAFGFRDKIGMLLCPYERFVYIDTDTLVLGELSEVFTLLDRFDFAGHQLFEGHDYRPPGVPDIFPDFNSGVMAFRRSPTVERFFERWSGLYDAFIAKNQGGYYHYANVGDQQSLRVAMYESDLRMAVLGPEYNFVPSHVNFACAPVRILHARGRPHLITLGDRINRQLGNRVYLPVMDSIVSAETLPSELVRLWSMTSLQILKLLARRVMPLALRNWLRQCRPFCSMFVRNNFSQPEAGAAEKWRKPPEL